MAGDQLPALLCLGQQLITIQGEEIP